MIMWAIFSPAHRGNLSLLYCLPTLEGNSSSFEISVDPSAENIASVRFVAAGIAWGCFRPSRPRSTMVMMRDLLSMSGLPNTLKVPMRTRITFSFVVAQVYHATRYSCDCRYGVVFVPEGVCDANALAQLESMRVLLLCRSSDCSLDGDFVDQVSFPGLGILHRTVVGSGGFRTVEA